MNPSHRADGDRNDLEALLEVLDPAAAGGVRVLAGGGSVSAESARMLAALLEHHLASGLIGDGELRQLACSLATELRRQARTRDSVRLAANPGAV